MDEHRQDSIKKAHIMGLSMAYYDGPKLVFINYSIHQQLYLSFLLSSSPKFSSSFSKLACAASTAASPSNSSSGSADNTKLMACMDTINAQYGLSTVHIAAKGLSKSLLCDELFCRRNTQQS
jgi:hypothetical protein